MKLPTNNYPEELQTQPRSQTQTNMRLIVYVASWSLQQSGVTNLPYEHPDFPCSRRSQNYLNWKRPLSPSNPTLGWSPLCHLSATSSHFWNMSRDGDSTTSLDSPYQCLTTLSMQKFSFSHFSSISFPISLALLWTCSNTSVSFLKWRIQIMELGCSAWRQGGSGRTFLLSTTLWKAGVARSVSSLR